MWKNINKTLSDSYTAQIHARTFITEKLTNNIYNIRYNMQTTEKETNICNQRQDTIDIKQQC